VKFLKEFDPHDRAFCSVAAAIIGAGALSAGASVWGSSKAADAQGAAADKAIANSQSMYNQNKDLLLPYINAGKDASGKLANWIDPTSGNNPLASLMKLVTPGADMSATLAQTPGFQFQQQQGTRAVMNALAGRGLAGSTGAVTKGVGDYVTGLAGTTWKDIVGALSGTIGQETNALQGLVSTGANAGSSLASQGTAAASSINSAITGAGNAQAASYNGIGSAIGGAGNSLSTAALLQQLTRGSGGGSVYGNEAFGGNGVWGGSSSNPIDTLDASDYGEGF